MLNILLIAKYLHTKENTKQFDFPFLKQENNISLKKYAL